MKKIIIPIILLALIISGYVVYRMDQNKICPAYFDPVIAKNIFTGETKTFSNSCEVSLWWKVK